MSEAIWFECCIQSPLFPTAERPEPTSLWISASRLSSAQLTAFRKQEIDSIRVAVSQQYYLADVYVKRDGEVGFCGIITEYFCSGSTVKKNWFVSSVCCRKRHFQSRWYSCSHTGEAMLINAKHQNKHLVAIIKTPTWQSCTNCCVMKSLAYFFGIIKFFKNIFDLITF